MNDSATEMDPNAAESRTISFVSLGCPKALVDSERILTRLRAEGYAISRNHTGADAVIVNTCGFLDSAKAELLAAIGEALKENGQVIVTGCMGAEPGPILDAFPKLSAITGPQDYESVMAAVHRAAPPRRILSSTWCRPRASNSPPAIMLISKYQRVAIIPAPSASSRNCAAIWFRAPQPRCCVRRKSWSRPG